MFARMLMRMIGPLRRWLTRLHWWCWREAATRRVPRTAVRSLADQADLDVAARGDYAAKVQAQDAIILPPGGRGPWGTPAVPYVPATTWARFEVEVRERAARLREGRA